MSMFYTAYSSVKNFYNGINPATLNGAIDVIMVKQKDGSISCGPFHVRFGKLGVLRAKEKVVDIEINGKFVEDIHMKLGEQGEAFFVEEADINHDIPEYLATSPLINDDSLTMMEEGLKKLKIEQENDKNLLLTEAKNNVAVQTDLDITQLQPLSFIINKQLNQEENYEKLRNTPPKDGSCMSFSCQTEIVPNRHAKRKLCNDEKYNRNSASSGNNIHHSGSEMHPFSDGDVTPHASPSSSRSQSPKSDSELLDVRSSFSEVQVSISDEDNNKVQDIVWDWGELPRSNVNTPEMSAKKDEFEHNISSSNSLKKHSNKEQTTGMYLSDVENDNEVASLYLYTNDKNSPNSQSSKSTTVNIKDDDAESGHGRSLPQSPTSCEMFMKHIEMDQDEKQFSCYPKIQLSLCGNVNEVNDKRFHDHLVTFETFSKRPDMVNDSNLVVKIDEKYYNWACAAPMILCKNVFNEILPEESMQGLVKNFMPKKRKGWSWWGRSGGNSEDVTKNAKNIKNKSEIDENEKKNEKLLKANSIKDKYRKATRLTSAQISKLNLKDGANEISYSVTTSYQGTSRLVSYIHLFRWDDRLIISDIDGTITKSDVLGQLLPALPGMIRSDWAQSGIAKLYQDIAKNGYKFIYLSARAIGQAGTTRNYLKSIKQQGVLKEHQLPDGPMLLNPSSLILAFHKEVIQRNPEEFKINCLNDIRALFPNDVAPFFAGYGNRINDVMAYVKVGVNKSRIFTVNHKGELSLETKPGFYSTYERMNVIVDHMFPPLVDDDRVPKSGSPKNENRKIESGSFPNCDEFSRFTYWRDPILTVSVDIEAFKKTGSISKPKPKTSESKNDKIITTVTTAAITATTTTTTMTTSVVTGKATIVDVAISATTTSNKNELKKK